MRKINLIFVLSLLFGFSANAVSFTKTNQGINLQTNALQIDLQFYSPSTVRVVKYPLGKSFVKESLSVVKSPDAVRFKITETADQVQLMSSELTVSVDKSSALIYFSRNNESLLVEKAVRFEDFNDVGSVNFQATQSFVLDKDEQIYGMGQQQDGQLSRRGVNLKMIQDNTEDYIPFFQSHKGYGLFWDNYSPTRFVDTPDSTYFKSEVADGIDYYFMVGKNADAVVAQMRELTGRAPMFPLWTFGFWQSRERYKSVDELLEVVRKYRELQIPLDGIIQDWQYWGDNYLWNATEFLNPGFKYGDRMIKGVHDQNAHIIISIWNSFGPKTKPYRELDSIGALFNFITWPQSGAMGWPPRMDYPSGVRVYDPYNAQARDIYWKYLKKNLFDLGIDGWWLDSSEPDHHNFKDSDLDEMTALGSFRKVRNAFPLMSVGGISTNQQKLSQDKRVFMLTRSAFAGQQRYGANLWSGDVTASWKALAAQVTAGLNVSAAAYPYWNSDIGGFFLWNFKDPLHNPDYRELQVRWMQFGVFTGMMRSHGEGYPREIYQFGEKGTPVYDAIEKCIRLRYNLLPYIYATSWQVTHAHSSLMRPLFMDFAKDEKVLTLNDQYMFGPSLLVCPITESMYLQKGANGEISEDFSSVKTKKIYLPYGTSWYDFSTGKKFQGGQELNTPAAFDQIPLFVKAGSILPWGPDQQFATQKQWDELEMRVYPGADGQFTLYEDEFDNYNYQKGKFATITFTWNDAKKTLTLGEQQGAYPGMIKNRKFNILFVGSDNPQPVQVQYTGKRISIRKDQ